jgi:hypothetical protein
MDFEGSLFDRSTISHKRLSKTDCSKIGSSRLVHGLLSGGSKFVLLATLPKLKRETFKEEKSALTPSP